MVILITRFLAQWCNDKLRHQTQPNNLSTDLRNALCMVVVKCYQVKLYDPNPSLLWHTIEEDALSIDATKYYKLRYQNPT